MTAPYQPDKEAQKSSAIAPSVIHYVVELINADMKYLKDR